MTAIKPIKFEIQATERGFNILAYMNDGKVGCWGKNILTERGAKARMTTFKKRYGQA